MKFIPYGRHCLDSDDTKEVAKVLHSDWITQGPVIRKFEEGLANYCGAKYAVAVSSGTAALHIASLAAGIKAGDEVITSPITFVSSANCVLYCGGKPIFADVGQDTANINPEQIANKISKRTKAVIPIHYAGHPCDLETIQVIAKKHNLVVIEDAAHAFGARYKNIKIGSAKYSDMAILSFHPVKSITTGEGGAILTNRREYYKKLIMFRQHGITKDGRQFKFSNQGQWYYEMHYLGYNYRLTDIQAALGLSQLRKLDKFIQRRRRIAGIYNRAFKNNIFFDLPIEKRDVKSSWHLYPIKLKDEYKDKKKLIFNRLQQEGLGVQVHYIPVYRQPYYRELGYRKGICPQAEDFYQREISLPLYPSMRDEDVSRVIETSFGCFRKIKK